MPMVCMISSLESEASPLSTKLVLLLYFTSRGSLLFVFWLAHVSLPPHYQSAPSSAITSRSRSKAQILGSERTGGLTETFQFRPVGYWTYIESAWRQFSARNPQALPSVIHVESEPCEEPEWLRDAVVFPYPWLL